MADPDQDKFWKLRNEFFSLVGQAITRWAYIDRDLFDFCRFALNTSEKMMAIIFYRSPSIGDHLNLTDSLIKAAQIEEMPLKRWGIVHAEITRLLPMRNDLAHNPSANAARIVLQANKNDPENGIASTEQWYEIHTEPMKLLRSTKNGQAKPIKIKSDDLRKYLEDVHRLEVAIHALRWDLLGRPKGLGLSVPAPIFPPDLG